MKILIISYYAFPLNAVSSYRIESFCEGFTKEGGDVTLLTRHWGASYSSLEDILISNCKPVEMSTNKGYREIKIPFIRKENTSKISKINTLKVFKSYLFGDLQPELDVYSNFKDFAVNLLNKEGDFDLILTSVQPDGMTKLVNYVSKQTNVPYVVDFRDFLNSKYLFESSRLSFREKVINFLKFHHTKRYLKNSMLAITVSPILQTVINDGLKKKTIIALNGYEKKYFIDLENKVSKNSIFTIRHIGTAYDHSNYSLIIDGIKKFKNKYKNRRIFVELVAIHHEIIEEKFKNILSDDELSIIRIRIPKESVVLKVVNTDILLLAWNDFKGNYGTKLFDYLASGSHILLSPPDNSVVEELIRKHENGSVAYTSDEVCAILEKQYLLWEQGKNKTPLNNYPQYERENIAKELYYKLYKTINE